MQETYKKPLINLLKICKKKKSDTCFRTFVNVFCHDKKKETVFTCLILNPFIGDMQYNTVINKVCFLESVIENRKLVSNSIKNSVKGPSKSKFVFKILFFWRTKFNYQSIFIYIHWLSLTYVKKDRKTFRLKGNEWTMVVGWMNLESRKSTPSGSHVNIP